MRVIVEDEGLEVFSFDQIKDNGRDYRSALPKAREHLIMQALTDAPRYVLHIQQQPR
jgi:hypothetical protein